jgi:hypothetical protein
MKKFEPTNFPEHKFSWESVVRGLYEASSRSQTAIDRINVVGYSFWAVVHSIFDALKNTVDENKITD